MQTIYILNGPPQSGKDVIVTALSKRHPELVHLEFKYKLIQLGLEFTGLTATEWYDIYNDRTKKETPNPVFGWNKHTRSYHTPRSLLIHISEEVVKPLFGDRYFGEALLMQIPPDSSQFIVSDGGFVDEVLPLIDAGHNVVIIRIHRPGYSYANDSRSYLYIKDILANPTYELGKGNLIEFDIDNDSTLYALEQQINNIITQHTP